MSAYILELEKYSTSRNKDERRVFENDTSSKRCKFEPRPDPILLKLYPEPHQLSAELQSLFIKLTEGAFGFSEQIRNESLKILSQDYHIKFLAPYLSVFIKDAIEINIAFPDLSLLIYGIRMVKVLMSNPHIHLKEHLHLLIPAVLSCAISRRISKYQHDNHWTLRDFSTQVIATICFKFDNEMNGFKIRKRVIGVYLTAIQDPRKPLPTLYGGLKGIGSLGEEAIKKYIIPLLSLLGYRISLVNKNGDQNDIKQMKRVRELILTIVSPILLSCRNVNDGGVSYMRDYGCLGYLLYVQVKNLQKMAQNRNSQCNMFLISPKPT